MTDVQMHAKDIRLRFQVQGRLSFRFILDLQIFEWMCETNLSTLSRRFKQLQIPPGS